MPAARQTSLLARKSTGISPSTGTRQEASRGRPAKASFHDRIDGYKQPFGMANGQSVAGTAQPWTVSLY